MEAISAEGEQCKRSQKDNCAFCRRHKYKQSYGTIHNKKIIDVNEQKPVINEINSDNSDGEIEIDQNGNIITLEDGRVVIYVPASGLVYSYTTGTPEN